MKVKVNCKQTCILDCTEYGCMVVSCAHFEIVDSAFFGMNLDENSILVPESCYVNHHSSETAWFEEKILDGGYFLDGQR